MYTAPSERSERQRGKGKARSGTATVSLATAVEIMSRPPQTRDSLDRSVVQTWFNDGEYWFWMISVANVSSIRSTVPLTAKWPGYSIAIVFLSTEAHRRPSSADGPF